VHLKLNITSLPHISVVRSQTFVVYVADNSLGWVKVDYVLKNFHL